MGIYGHVIWDIKARQEDFLFFEIVHANRSTNVDAHRLTRSSIYASLGRHVWFIDPP
jgi:hypothetical protein